MSSSGANSNSDSSERVINLEDVKIIVKKVTNDPSVEVLDYNLKSYSKDKLGHMGSHLQLTVTVQQSNSKQKENLNFFVKAILPEHVEKDDSSIEKGLFAKESKFFETLVGKLTEHYTGEKWSPTFYLVKNGAIVMEDLRLRGYKLLGIEIFDNYAAIKSTLATLARYHACSILAEAHSRRESQLPVRFKDEYPDICKEIVFDQKSEFLVWVTHSINLAVSIGDHLGYDTKKFRIAFNRMYDIVKPSKIHRNVMCHGDLWTNNLMFNEENHCVLVDFQLIRYNPLVVDILELLYMNTSIDFRRKHERNLVEFYQSILRDTVSKDDVLKIASAPTLEEILFGLEDLRLFGPAIACLFIPTILIDPKILDDGTQDTKDESDNFVFRDRTKVTLEYIEKDLAFKRRLDEAVSELVKISENF